MGTNPSTISSRSRTRQTGHAIQALPTSPAGACQLVPKSTKPPQSRIPEPQAWRVKQKFITGETIRSIARSENLARETVTRIVRSEDMNSYVLSLRQQFYSLGSSAITAVQKALDGGDARLAYQLLTDIGVIPTVQEKVVVGTQPAASDDDENAGVKRILEGFVHICIARAKNYGTPMGEIGTALEQAGGKFDTTTGELKLIE